MPVGVAPTSVNGQRTGHYCAEVSDAESPERPSASNVYAEGQSYAEGWSVSAEGDLRRGATPTAALGVGYADGLPWLGRGLSTVGAAADSCSVTASCLPPIVGRGGAIWGSHGSQRRLGGCREELELWRPGW